MSPTMRAAGVTGDGRPVRVFALPHPGAPVVGDVLIAVHAAGVGNWDELMRRGVWQSGLRGPHALGVEVAGVVVRTGPTVRGLAVGDEVAGYVFPLRSGGAWAEYMLAPAASLARKPAELPWEAAAALPVPGLTALQTLTDVLAVESGERLFVHGAGGVTGGLLVQLAALRGVRVVVTAGLTSNSRLREFGAATVVDRARPDWCDQVLTALDGRPETVVNAVPGGADHALAVTADGGRFATLAGAVSTPRPEVDAFDVVVRPDAHQLAILFAMLDSGDISVSTERAFPLDAALAALGRARSGAHGSAVVLRIA
jgi:NADPH:quinone reductase-like Zn-dependent oxidoreductase